MSERLVIPNRTDAESEVSVAHPWWEFSVRFNVAVTHSVPVARLHERETEGVMMRWGLVPSAVKADLTRVGCALARSDSLQRAEDLSSAWLHGRRGIVPVAGFYIWQRTSAGYRQPYYVRLVNRLVFGVAALWERSVNDEDEVLESCALVTVPANPLLAEIGNDTDQMPAILRREDYTTWLGATVPQANEVLKSYPHIQMVTHPVGPYVDDLERDEPRLIQPAP
jgi:putative SOS response-associated peptidase YedK